MLVIKTLKGVLKQINTSDNFLKHFFRGFNGVKGGCYFKIPLCALKNNFTTKQKLTTKKLKNKFFKKEY